ncbi:MAG: hypothetical protein ACYTDT_09130 [Planctomycetota bacterium]
MTHEERLLEQDMNEVFNAEAPPNLIDATLARVNQPIEIDEVATQAAIPPLRGVRWLAAAMIVLALGLSVYVMWQPSGGYSNGPSLLAPGEIPVGDDVDAINEYLGTATGLKARMLESPRPGGDPMLVPVDEDEITRIVDLIASSITGIPTSRSDWAPDKEIQLVFPEGTGTIQYNSGKLLSVKLPGWSGDREYDANASFVDAIQHWVDESVTQHEDDIREEPAIEWKVGQRWEGSDSAAKERQIIIARDEKAWIGIWDIHRPKREKFILPQVDFNTHIVLAVFGGEKFNSRGYYIDSVLGGRNSMIIRIDENTYQTAGKAVKAGPYGFWVLPNHRSITVEENVQGLLNKPPLWNKIKAYEFVGSSDAVWLADRPRIHHAFTGEDFRIGTEETHIITTQDKWESLKRRAVGNLQINMDWPDVDFRTQWIFARFGPGLKGFGGFSLEIAGSTDAEIHFRTFFTEPKHVPHVRAKMTNIHGMWVLSRDSRRWVQETGELKVVGDPLKWQEEQPIVVKQEFGVIASKTAYDGQHKSVVYYLVKKANILADVSQMSGVKLPKDFADLGKEMVLVIFDERARLFEGMSIEVEGESKITYSMTGPSGVDPGHHSQVGFFVLPKHDKPISLYRSVTVGPSQPNVKLVKEFK